MSDPDDRVRGRESSEPDELNNPVPWPVAVIAVIVVCWGAWYYFQNVGFPVGAGDRRSAIVIDPNAAIDGSVVYAGNCAACHQANGAGLAGVFPPLADSAWVTENEARLIQILLHGVNGELVVQGQVYNGVMPAFGQLGDGELAAVMTYVRASWGNQAGAIAPADVAAGRERFPERTQAWSGGQELNEVFGSP